MIRGEYLSTEYGAHHVHADTDGSSYLRAGGVCVAAPFHMKDFRRLAIGMISKFVVVWTDFFGAFFTFCKAVIATIYRKKVDDLRRVQHLIRE